MRGRLEPRVEKLEAEAGRSDGSANINVVFVGPGEALPVEALANTMYVRFVEPGEAVAHG